MGGDRQRAEVFPYFVHVLTDNFYIPIGAFQKKVLSSEKIKVTGWENDFAYAIVVYPGADRYDVPAKLWDKAMNKDFKKIKYEEFVGKRYKVLTYVDIMKLNFMKAVGKIFEISEMHPSGSGPVYVISYEGGKEKCPAERIIPYLFDQGEDHKPYAEELPAEHRRLAARLLSET